MYVAAVGAVAIAPVVTTSGTTQAAAHATHAVTRAAVRHVNMSRHMHIDCSTAAAMCAEVASSSNFFEDFRNIIPNPCPQS
jgi:hypothetical protein